jgi:hypothetical protein
MKSIIIKQTWYYLLYIFLLFFSPIYSLERIDLIKSCDLNNQCTQRLWQITDSFSEDFIKPDFNPTLPQIHLNLMLGASSSHA